MLAALALASALATGAHGQTAAAGRLLVASPGIDDPNFSETVLLILLHQDGGSAAVFLNRPTWVDPSEAFPEIDALAGYDGALYLGGPVGPTEFLTLFEADGPAPDSALPLGEGIFFSPNPALLGQLDFTAPDGPRVRVYAGHAEWGPGQLAAEIAAERWRVLRAGPEHVFAEDPSTLWESLLVSRDGVSASIF